jgi:hypothetical protein
VSCCSMRCVGRGTGSSVPQNDCSPRLILFRRWPPPAVCDYNEGRLRKVLHSWIAASFVWAFVQAPFDHTHDRDPHHEHATGFAHTHSYTAQSNQLGWTANDESSDARSTDWVIATGKSPIPFQALVPHAVVVPEPAPVAGTIAQPTPRNHDPPRVRNLRSRAPPA